MPRISLKQCVVPVRQHLHLLWQGVVVLPELRRREVIHRFMDVARERYSGLH
jgi:hypothetical protein